MRLAEGGSLQEHIKAMTEVLDGLSAIDEPAKEKDRVVYLLASLPDAYNVLVIALEANADVPKLEVVRGLSQIIFPTVSVIMMLRGEGGGGVTVIFYLQHTLTFGR